MKRKASVLSLLVLMVLATPIYSDTTYLYFSDFSHCETTYTVYRDTVIQIEGKRSSEAGSSVFTDCSLLFRAGNLEDKLCMKITTLIFSSNNLQFQYFKSLDPTVGSPDLTYDSSNPASTPTEVCDNLYEISMKMRALDASAKINEVSVLIEIYNMQGTQRIAYMDTDCALVYKLRDSTVFVQNTDPDGPNTLQSVCQLYFEYIGTNPNYTVCINYQKTKDTCSFDLKVFDGDVSGSSLAHTYTCSQTSPQQWCGTGSAIFLELINTGSDPLPSGVFAVEVYDAAKGTALATSTPTSTPTSTSTSTSMLSSTSATTSSQTTTRSQVYFSDFNQCELTYTVARDAIIQIEGKRSSEAGSSAFTDCSLMFRAGNLEDTLCMKITTLTFSSNKLQFQYFKSLDPTVGLPDVTYDSANPASTPVEVCDNEYEISMKLHALAASATLSQVDILIEVYNMQATGTALSTSTATSTPRTKTTSTPTSTSMATPTPTSMATSLSTSTSTPTSASTSILSSTQASTSTQKSTSVKENSCQTPYVWGVPILTVVLFSVIINL